MNDSVTMELSPCGSEIYHWRVQPVHSVEGGDGMRVVHIQMVMLVLTCTKTDANTCLRELVCLKLSLYAHEHMALDQVRFCQCSIICVHNVQ